MNALACSVAALLAASTSAPAVYTNEVLERMFGSAEALPQPAPAAPESTAELTRVEEFLRTSYARIDADRRFERETGLLTAAARRSGGSINDKFSIVPGWDTGRFAVPAGRSEGACLLDSRLQPGDPCYDVWRVMLPRRID